MQLSACSVLSAIKIRNSCLALPSTNVSPATRMSIRAMGRLSLSMSRHALHCALVGFSLSQTLSIAAWETHPLLAQLHVLDFATGGEKSYGQNDRTNTQLAVSTIRKLCDFPHSRAQYRVQCVDAQDGSAGTMPKRTMSKVRLTDSMQIQNQSHITWGIPKKAISIKWRGG